MKKKETSMGRERILILCGLSLISEEFRNEKYALECATETLDFMMMQIGEPGFERSIFRYSNALFLAGRPYSEGGPWTEEGEPRVARANSEWGKKWIKMALENPGIWNEGIPIYTLYAHQIESEEKLNEILKNGSELFNKEKSKKIEAGEIDETSNVFIVPVDVNY